MDSGVKSCPLTNKQIDQKMTCTLRETVASGAEHQYMKYSILVWNSLCTFEPRLNKLSWDQILSQTFMLG